MNAHMFSAHSNLLIVPYGIETMVELNINFKLLKLLIVPYGIETIAGITLVIPLNLLIVPYGIETTVAPVKVLFAVNF